MLNNLGKQYHQILSSLDAMKYDWNKNNGSIIDTPFIFSYDIEITDEIVGRAPIPELIVGVKQDGM